MKIISHRGNINGICSDENNPKLINYILKNLQINVEIDLWYVNNNFFLGHDFPIYKIFIDFLKNENLWIHCKNINAFSKLRELNINYLNYFFHNTDLLTITSLGIPWCNYNIYIKGGITVMKDNEEPENKNILGICTDYPSLFIKKNDK